MTKSQGQEIIAVLYLIAAISLDSYKNGYWVVTMLFWLALYKLSQSLIMSYKETNHEL